MKSLIIIDYTNDFVALDGKLTAGQPAIDIEETMVKIAQNHTEIQDFVVYAVDHHDYAGDKYHPEHKLFPPHNIIGTDGIKQFGKLEEYLQETKQNENVYYMPKRRYSAFSGTDLDIRLRERNIKEIFLIGVCTDICVLHTAIDAYNLGYKINVYKEAVASFNEKGHKIALEHFKNVLGANIL